MLKPAVVIATAMMALVVVPPVIGCPIPDRPRVEHKRKSKQKMRLQEATAYPFKCNRPAPNLVDADLTAIIGDTSPLLVGAYVNSTIFFPIAKLGRRWRVNRLTINPVKVTNWANSEAATAQIAITFRPYLNDLPIADAATLTYSLVQNQVILEAQPIDITSQRAPLIILPYNDLEINPSDQLKVRTEVGLPAGGPYTAGKYLALQLCSRLEVTGENIRA